MKPEMGGLRWREEGGVVGSGEGGQDVRSRHHRIMLGRMPPMYIQVVDIQPASLLPSPTLPSHHRSINQLFTLNSHN